MTNTTEKTYTFDFNSRETYLAYRDGWRAAYVQLSNDIRADKLRIKEAQRTGGWTNEWQLRAMQKQATEMLAERAASKVEAQRQYLATHQATASAA